MSANEDKPNFSRNRGISAVIYQISRKGKHLYEPVKSVPSTLLIVVLGVYLLLGYFTQLVEDSMPSVVRESSVARDDSITFSEEVAYRHLLRIVGDEPRVAGTLYHLNKTHDMKAIVDEVALQANQVVRTDWQFASGDYFHNSSASFVNIYQNASNIVALLEGESGFLPNGTIGSSILVNCHYDSVPYALGASDNAAFCAIMVETLTKMSRSKQKLKHNVVFLFNGAEENGLQASHAFLQHPWAEGVTAVINLDAAGMNGKPTIFQATDPRVLNAYSRSVPRPNAQGLAEFMFYSGIIPSDTDFRIWREFGNIQGIDIAFVKWAHVYHTRNDRPELLLPGVLQNAGDMLLALASRLADTPAMRDKVESTSEVYYDYLNVFLVSYSFPVSYAVDICIALFGLASVGYYVWLVGARKSTLVKLSYAAGGRLVSLLGGVLLVAVLVPLMILTTVQMRYLTQAWLVVPLYWLPYLLGALAAAQALDAWSQARGQHAQAHLLNVLLQHSSGLSRSLRCAQAQAGSRLLLVLSLLLLLCVPALTTLRYLFSAPLFIMAATSIISITILRYVTLQGWQHLILEVCLSSPALMFMCSLALRLNAQVLPIMSRSAGNYPDLTVAALNVGLAVLVAATVSGIELLFSRKHLWLVLSGVGAVCFVLMFIPFSPYDEDGISLQRHYWFHSEIVSYDISGNTTSRTSGIVVSKHDPYTSERVGPALAAAGVHLVSRDDFQADCEELVYCGLPLFRTSFGRYLKHALFLYTGGPAPFSPPAAFTTLSRECVGDTCSFSFLLTGANHNLVTLWPLPGVSVTSWSLSSAPSRSHSQRGRPVYVLYHSTATYSGEPVSMVINVTFNVPQSQQSQPIVEVSHHSHKIHHPQDYTDEYRNILQAMPRYFNIASFLSFRHNYVF
ncbi:endoplasmic reticulum metallopeptidase 1-like isoform X2 [Trichoplusia ni]|uniref:FXNA-like protease n=1 Tax=Trichoplusia ni TaxID=7111 RepID=A0A7E5W482_TRINI|nr:endoplasmic reticulum metallopeptidase 1-like isoform X2 [Trichoplusia ni]